MIDSCKLFDGQRTDTHTRCILVHGGRAAVGAAKSMAKIDRTCVEYCRRLMAESDRKTGKCDLLIFGSFVLFNCRPLMMIRKNEKEKKRRIRRVFFGIISGATANDFFFSQWSLADDVPTNKQKMMKNVPPCAPSYGH